MPWRDDTTLPSRGLYQGRIMHPQRSMRVEHGHEYSPRYMHGSLAVPGRAADERDELAPPHSITSSVRASSVGGTFRPRTFAVLRLMFSSTLVTCRTGK